MASETKPPMEAAELFDSVGKPYEEAFRDVPGQLKSLKWLISQLQPNSKILDVGCGTGHPACSMLVEAGKGFDVTGIDVSPVMVDLAKTSLPTATFHLASILSWSPPHKFDAIIIYFSLIASISQSQIRETFPKLASYLSDSGILIFGTVVVEGDMLVSKWMGRECVVSGLSKDENVKCIEESGFEVLQVEEERFVPKGEEAGLCRKEDVWEEPMLFVYARKK